MLNFPLVAQPWLRAHKAVDLLCLAALTQTLVRRWLNEPVLLSGVAGNVIVGLMVVAVAAEFWSLQARSRFCFSPALVPLVVLVGALAAIWIVDPLVFPWVLAGIFLAFMRLPVVLATWIGSLAMAAAISILAWHWQYDPRLQVRTTIAGFFIVVMFNLFFQANRKMVDQLTQTRDLLDGSMHAMSQGMFLIDQAGRVKMFNERACQLLDLPRSMLESQPLMSELSKFQLDRGDFGADSSVVWESSHRHMASSLADLKGKASQSYLRQDRSGRFIEVNTHPMPSGDVVRTYTDVSEYEQVNRHLKVVLEEYEQLSQNILNRSREQMVLALTDLALMRDKETGQHIRRTQMYFKTLAQALLRDGKYPDQLSESVIDLMVKAAPMHDLGKVGIPDHILLKPGRHTEHETMIMRTHSTLGETILQAASGRSPETDSIFAVAARIAGGHHENWDGSGYPRGLVGTDIPLEARLMAVADVYDALTTPRAYKKAWTHQEASGHIEQYKGVKFDPEVVDAFLKETEAFQVIAMTLAESASSETHLSPAAGSLPN